MIKQTDPRNSQAVYHFGCYMFSLINIAGIRQNKDFQFDEITAIYKAAMATILSNGLPIVGPEKYADTGAPTDGCFVNDAHAFLTLCGCPNAQILMGPLSAGMFSPDATEKDDASVSIIQEWKHGSFTHYVTGNPDGSVEFDSIDYGDGLGSNTIRQGILTALRLIKFV